MTALPIFLRPSTKIQEIDLTQRTSIILSTICSVVGEFERGPLEPTYQDGVVENFKKRYGLIANPQISFAHDTVTTAMTQTNNMLVTRVVNNALYSGTSLVFDRSNNRLLFFPFKTGAKQNFENEGLSQLVLIAVNGTLSTGHTLAMDITDGTSIGNTGTITFATSHNATMQAFANAIQTRLDGFVVGGSVEVHQETTSSTSNAKLIAIRVPNTVSLTFLNLVAGGTTPPTVVLDEEARLADLFAENPGEWGDNYGAVISRIDEGVRERYRLTVSTAITTGQSISMTINGTPLVPTPFATNSDATLAEFAKKIQAHPDVLSAEVETISGAVNNDRSILIVAQNPGPALVKFQNGLIVGGSNPGVMSVVTTMTGVAADRTFYLDVFNRDNVNVLEERFEVSFSRQLSRLGYQQNIMQVVNRTQASINIRVVQSPYTQLPTFDLYPTGAAPTAPTTISWMSGGSDGYKATSADIRKGWLQLTDRQIYPMNVLLNGGYTAVSVQKEMDGLAKKRSDCFAVLDAPSDKQQAQVMQQYRLTELDIDSSFSAMYLPDVEIEDIDTGEKRYIPPSGPIGATYAYSDRLTNSMGAPAGLNRGKVSIATGLRYNYTEAEQELLYPVGLNAIVDRRGIGPVVMAEETLQFKKTVMSSVHARRILNYIKTGLVDGLDYTLFDPNNPSTRFRAVQLGETILAPMKRPDGNGGLIDYRIVCDESNNPQEVIDADQLGFDVYLKVVRVVKGINVRAILTRTGANFDELIVNGF